MLQRFDKVVTGTAGTSHLVPPSAPFHVVRGQPDFRVKLRVFPSNPDHLRNPRNLRNLRSSTQVLAFPSSGAPSV
jgi:hypothetical protein